MHHLFLIYLNISVVKLLSPQTVGTMKRLVGRAAISGCNFVDFYNQKYSNFTVAQSFWNTFASFDFLILITDKL